MGHKQQPSPPSGRARRRATSTPSRAAASPRPGHQVAHGLGHGVGLVVHEAPRLSDTSDETVEARAVVTIEPGVYVAGRGGVRIEDFVVVTDAGPEVRTTFTKDLVVLG